MFGPLGRGYSISPQAQNVLLVAGGLGVAAVIALADEAIAANRSVTLLQGARSANKLYPPDLLPQDVEAVSATDDGSTGHHGVVTDLLPEYLPWADQVFACGPTPMFAGMAKVMRAAQKPEAGAGAARRAHGLRHRHLLRLRRLHPTGRAAGLQRRPALRTTQRVRLAFR